MDVISHVGIVLGLGTPLVFGLSKWRVEGLARLVAFSLVMMLLAFSFYVSPTVVMPHVLVIFAGALLASLFPKNQGDRVRLVSFQQMFICLLCLAFVGGMALAVKPIEQLVAFGLATLCFSWCIIGSDSDASVIEASLKHNFATFAAVTLLIISYTGSQYHFEEDWLFLTRVFKSLQVASLFLLLGIWPLHMPGLDFLSVLSFPAQLAHIAQRTLLLSVLGIDGQSPGLIEGQMIGLYLSAVGLQILWCFLLSLSQERLRRYAAYLLQGLWGLCLFFLFYLDRRAPFTAVASAEYFVWASLAILTMLASSRFLMQLSGRHYALFYDFSKAENQTARTSLVFVFGVSIVAVILYALLQLYFILYQAPEVSVKTAVCLIGLVLFSCYCLVIKVRERPWAMK